MCRALVLSLTFLLTLTACGSSEPPAPAANAPEISPEVAAAPGRIYLKDGAVRPADEWWESGTILFYRWNGEQQRVLKDSVARIEGQPRPRETVVATETRSTLGSAVRPTPQAPSGPSPEELRQRRLSDCRQPVIGDTAAYVENYIGCVTSRHGMTVRRTEGQNTRRWELTGSDGSSETYEATGPKVTLAFSEVLGELASEG